VIYERASSHAYMLTFSQRLEKNSPTHIWI